MQEITNKYFLKGKCCITANCSSCWVPRKVFLKCHFRVCVCTLLFSRFLKSCSGQPVVWAFTLSVAPSDDTAVCAQMLLDNKWSSSSETHLPLWWLRQSKQLHFCQLFCPILRKNHSCKKIKINQGASIQVMSLLSSAFSTELYCVTDSEVCITFSQLLRIIPLPCKYY